MTIAIDFNKPVTTDAYTAWPTTIQAAAQGLGAWLDSALVTTSNTPNGTKRFNSTSGLFEQWTGSWVALAVGYAKTAGDTFTGAVSFANNIALQWKDAGGTARSIVNVNASNDVYVGDIGNALTGRSLFAAANTAVNFSISGTTIASVLAASVTMNKVAIIAAGAAESLRMTNDGAFISGYNTANSQRTGYLQFSTNASVILYAENGANLLLGTGGSTAVTIDTSRNFGFRTTPNAWGTLTALQGTAGSIAFNGTSSFYLTQNIYFNGGNWIYQTTGPASSFTQGAGVFQWNVVASGTVGGTATLVPAMTLDNNGNLLIGSTSANFNAAGRGLLELNGSATSLLAYKIGGTSSGYVYHDGTNFTLNNLLSGSVVLATANVARLTIDNIGRNIFSGSAYTARVALGSQSTLTVDWSKGNYFTMTLTANVAAGGWLFSNAGDGQTITIRIVQDGTGTRTLASNAAILWPGGVLGVLSTAPGAVDFLTLTFDAGVNKYHATLLKGFA